MRFCSKCGNSIKDIENCCSVCGEPVERIIERSSTYKDSPYSIPDAYSQSEKKKSNAGSAALVFILFIAIVAFVVGMINYKGSKGADTERYNSYDSALDALADSLTKADGKAACRTMLTKEMMENITQEQFDSISDTISFLNETVSQVTGEKPEWNFTTKSSVKLTDDDISSIKYYYSSHVGMDIEIDKAYQVKVKMSFGDQSDYVYINVIKVPDEGWKVSEEFLSTVTGSVE